MKNTATLGSSILEMHHRDSQKAAIRLVENKVWKEITWTEYQSEIFKVASALIQNQISSGDKVAICSSTKLSWALIDLATLCMHGVTIPIYPNNTAEEIEFIINHSETKILFLETKNHLKIWNQISKKCPRVQKVIWIDSSESQDSQIQSWKRFIESGHDYLNKNKPEIIKSIESMKISDMATLVYTSGTTGEPKAAVLTHEQIMSEISEAFPLCGATAQDTTLTFLPFAHVLGRIEIWAHVYIGYTMAYAESLEKIRNNLVDVKPTFMMAVPRIFEKIYTAIWSQLEGNPTKRKLFNWAIDVGKKVSEKKLHRQNLPLALVLEYELAKKIVLNKIADAFGGQLRFAISGGAPIHYEICQFFHAAGVLILEGYGLTETTAAICVNTPFNYRFGAVGRPIGDVELKIASDGEILVKSKKVMKGYYKDEVATNNAFEDGWFKTGDIGEILETGELRITDRKKDLIKTAGGKYVAPQKLEGLVKMSPIVSQVLIHGDQKKYIVALITLDPIYLKKLAQENAWKYSVWTDLLLQTEVTDMVRKAIADANAQLASFESIKKFTILPQEFTVEGGELTASMKVKRKYLDKKLKAQIDALYT